MRKMVIVGVATMSLVAGALGLVVLFLCLAPTFLVRPYAVRLVRNAKSWLP
jgi:hypothetical protein